MKSINKIILVLFLLVGSLISSQGPVCGSKAKSFGRLTVK
jgi:hypothetical protein